MKKLFLATVLSFGSFAFASENGTVLVIDKIAPKNDAFVGVVDASQTVTNVTNFDNSLSAADTDVQKALDTLDEAIGSGGTGTPGGSVNQFQFHSSTGAFDGSSDLVTTGSTIAATNLQTATLTVVGNSYFVNTSSTIWTSAWVVITTGSYIKWPDGTVQVSSPPAASVGGGGSTIENPMARQIYLSFPSVPCQSGNGCTQATQYQTATTSTVYVSPVFVAGSTTFAQTSFLIPNNVYSSGSSTFTVQIDWTSTAAANANFYVDMKAVANGESLDDGAWGTAVNIFDVSTSTGAEWLTPLSSVITPAGSPSAMERLFIRVSRGDSGNDVYPLGIMVNYLIRKLGTD